MLGVLLNNFKLTSNFLERKTVRELVLFLCRNQVDKVEVGLEVGLIKIGLVIV
ncbi:hypothetical protein QE357_001063 [Siphonobacter sp. BAB-5404]|nr:hypothetical protein [Siphonobacter sp. SORGH_AS_0500]